MCQKYFEWITSWHLGNTGGIYKWHFSFASMLDLRLPQFFNSSSLQTDTVEDDQQVFQALILIWLLLCKGFGFGSIGSLWEVIRGWPHLHWPLQGKAEPASQVGDASLNLRKGKNTGKGTKKSEKQAMPGQTAEEAPCRCFWRGCSLWRTCTGAEKREEEWWREIAICIVSAAPASCCSLWGWVPAVHRASTASLGGV